MKYLHLALISLVISLSAHAKIENKVFLNSILLGCVEEEDEEFSAIFSVGDQFEFCGCYVNEIAKNMDIKEAVSLGLDILKEGDSFDEEINDEQLEILLSNKKIEEGLINCMVKVLE